MKRPKLTKAFSREGSWMGRPQVVEEPAAEIKFNLYAMPMSADGCYDTGGAYWGSGNHVNGWMFHAYGEGPKFVNEVFVRATGRDEAKAKVLKLFANAKFYR